MCSTYYVGAPLVQIYNKLSQSCTTAFPFLPCERVPLYPLLAAVHITRGIILARVFTSTPAHCSVYYLGE